jgi:mannose-6-phosphate isomerase
MELLASPIRAYSWGSRTAIAAIQGRPGPTEQPEAELWMGAHPDSPSTIRRPGGEIRLDDAITSDPVGLLGAASMAHFGPRLPFMLKVLAADSPLSLQAHPDPETAARRYADEAGLPPEQRLYTDPYAKPELLVAVDDFDTLCGFRDPGRSADVIEAMGVPELAPVVAMLRSGPIGTRLRSAVETLLRWPAPERTGIVAAVVAGAARQGLGGIVSLGERFADDMGVVVALLLNNVQLSAGDAIWMPDGNLHAYLRGTGVELLASSDNVLRGGLTRKPIAIEELLRVLRFEVLPDPVVKPVALADDVVTWPVPAPEFALIRAVVTADGEAVALDADGPRIVFCISGEIAADDGTPIRLRGGESAFGAAGRPLTISGDGVVFVASTGSQA